MRPINVAVTIKGKLCHSGFRMTFTITGTRISRLDRREELLTSDVAITWDKHVKRGEDWVRYEGAAEYRHDVWICDFMRGYRGDLTHVSGDVLTTQSRELTEEMTHEIMRLIDDQLTTIQPRYVAAA